MRTAFDEKLSKIKCSINVMGETATNAVATAIASFIGNDSDTAGRSRKMEKEVDCLYREIDDLCIHVIATQQPAAVDLRFLVSSLNIASEVERIADYANNIAKTVQKKFPHMEVSYLALLRDDIKNLSDAAVQMLYQALQAYASNDPDMAVKVVEQDQTVNKMNKELIRKMLEVQIVDSGVQAVVLEYYNTIRCLERVADRATNIAEWVYFATTGERYRDVFPKIKKKKSEQPSE